MIGYREEILSLIVNRVVILVEIEVFLDRLKFILFIFKKENLLSFFDESFELESCFGFWLVFCFLEFFKYRV